MKYVLYFGIACQYLRKNKYQALSLIIPLTFIIFLLAAMSFFRAGVEKDALLSVHHFPDILLQQQVGGHSETLRFYQYRAFLEGLEELKAFYPRAWGYVQFKNQKEQDKSFLVMGIPTAAIQSGDFMQMTLEQGLFISDDEEFTGVIGKALARSMNCAVGDTVQIQLPGAHIPVPVKVVGIFTSSVQIYSADLMVVSLATARKILGLLPFLEESSDVLVYLKNPQSAALVADTIAAQAQVMGARPISKEVMLAMTEQAFGQKSGTFQLLWLILLINVVLIAWSLMSQLTFGYKKEIGILKAIGWDTGDVIALKTIETLIIGFTSTTAGILGGIVYMLFDAPLLKSFIIGWTSVYPDFPIPLYIEWSTVFILICLGVFPLLAGTIFPIWKIGSEDPDDLIKH